MACAFSGSGAGMIETSNEGNLIGLVWPVLGPFVQAIAALVIGWVIYRLHEDRKDRKAEMTELRQRIETVRDEAREQRTGIANSLRALIDERAKLIQLDRLEQRMVQQIETFRSGIMEHINLVRKARDAGDD